MQPLPQVDNCWVFTLVRRVDAKNYSSVLDLCRSDNPANSWLRQAGWNKLVFRRIREDPAHTDLHKVAILAVVVHPFLQLLLVCSFDSTAVYLRALPAVFIFAEAFAETPGVTRRVPERNPDDFGVFVRQRTLGNLPHQIGNVGRFVEYHDDALTLVVKPGESLGVMLRPWDSISAPAFIVTGIVAVHRRGCAGKPLFRNSQVRPFDDFRPCLGAQLVVGVGGHHHLAILAGRHAPVNQHRDEGAVMRDDIITGQEKTTINFKTNTRPFSGRFNTLNPLCGVPFLCGH